MRPQYNQILCVLSSTSGQDALITKAVALSKLHQANLTIQLALPALPPNARLVMASFAYIESQESLICDAERWLCNHVDNLDTGWPVHCEVTVGDVSQDVLETVSTLSVDLVIAQAKSGVSGRLFGADALHLLRHCASPVWLLPASSPPHHNVVIAAVDLNYHYGNEHAAVRKGLNKSIVQQASALALLSKGVLHLVHVYESIPEQYICEGLLSMPQDELATMNELIRQERDQAMASLVIELQASLQSNNECLDIQTHLVYGQPVAGIATTALQLDADVVVVGSITQPGIPGWLAGSIAEELAGELHCSILAIKPGQISADDQ
ncbi:hypothetical protein FJ444_21065 [Aestuariibacter sp. GS-14]|uniref:universal stress protein n=1 Tax=Aestuariibacter sp. GS-14 TaxID=2590670 RepID=UPI001128AD64|nr:universal stress protein [Aestuariibacter sp. GS-14]TPV52739.1 hypothetical protein FJ444_21065 [Aestuariibacter sp. GS-14]